MRFLDQFCLKFLFIVVIMASGKFPGCLGIEDYSQLEQVENLMGCFNTTITLTCNWPSVMLIKAASYGRASSEVCSRGRNAYEVCDIVDKKTVVKDMCDYKNKCEIFIGRSKFGNHCPLVDKYLSVIWACEKNPEKPTFPSPTATLLSNNTLNHNTTTNQTHPTTTPTTTPHKQATKKTRTRSPIKKTTMSEGITFNPNAPDANAVLSNPARSTLDATCTTYKLTLMAFTVAIALSRYTI